MDSNKGILAISLLNIDIILSASRKQVIILTFISKGIKRVEILDSGHKILSLFLGENSRPEKVPMGEGGPGFGEW